MRIDETKNFVELLHECRLTGFVWGYHGIGKSSLVRQLCTKRRMGFIDFRCSQIEATDIRGLPSERDDRTVYLPTEDMPVGGMSYEEYEAKLEAIKDDAERARESVRLMRYLDEGILFLDEVNRAPDDVLQAIFQLVNDGRVGMYVLPPKWSVQCAGNYSKGYITNGFNDPALMDRFCHGDLSADANTIDEWVDFVGRKYGEFASDAIEYASQNIKHLDGEKPDEPDKGFTIQPTRRSWERVIQISAHCAQSGKFGEDTRRHATAGYVGMENAVAYMNHSCPVKWRDVLNKGVKPLKDKLDTLNRNQLQGLMWGIISGAKEKISEDKKTGETCRDFAKYMLHCPHSVADLVVAFAGELITADEGNDLPSSLQRAALTNTELAQMICEVLEDSGSTKTGFLQLLNEDPELQSLLSRTAWGEDDENKVAKPKKKGRKKK